MFTYAPSAHVRTLAHKHNLAYALQSRIHTPSLHLVFVHTQALHQCPLPLAFAHTNFSHVHCSLTHACTCLCNPTLSLLPPHTHTRFCLSLLTQKDLLVYMLEVLYMHVHLDVMYAHVPCITHIPHSQKKGQVQVDMQGHSCDSSRMCRSSHAHLAPVFCWSSSSVRFSQECSAAASGVW